MFGASCVTPIMAGQLYGIGPADPVTLAGVPAVLLGVAMLACVVPGGAPCVSIRSRRSGTSSPFPSCLSGSVFTGLPAFCLDLLRSVGRL